MSEALRPWEETWSANRNGIDLGEPSDSGVGPNLAQFNGDDDHPDPMSDRSRARLAAAAPEMARLLRDLHDEHGPRHTFDWAYWFDQIERVLDKAGVDPVSRPVPASGTPEDE